MRRQRSKVLNAIKHGAGPYSTLFVVEDDDLLSTGFPDDFIFCGTKKGQWGMVGRAVPLPFAEAVARAIH